MATQTTYEHFLVTSPAPFVAHVQINRPQKLNAFFEAMWLEFKTIFDTLSFDPEIRAIILSGAGAKAFTAGLDVQAASQEGILKKEEGRDVARQAVGIKRHVVKFQDCISSVEKCEKRTHPVFSPSMLERIHGVGTLGEVDTGSGYC
jgi:delta(3,5)-delta(2,4)-dienoyl-CoA isomerase